MLWKAKPYSQVFNALTHLPWCRIYASVKWVHIGPDNGLAPNRHQAIIWINAGLLSNGTSGRNFSEISSEIHTFSFTTNVIC